MQITNRKYVIYFFIDDVNDIKYICSFNASINLALNIPKLVNLLNYLIG